MYRQKFASHLEIRYYRDIQIIIISIFMNLFTKNIAKLKIFHWIDDEVVKEILTRSSKETFPKDFTIIEEWAFPDWKGYIINSGDVSVSIAGQKIVRLYEWNMFGEIALLNEEPRTATVVAESDVEVIVLSQDILLEMIQNDDNTINKEIMRRMEENLENE